MLTLKKILLVGDARLRNYKTILYGGMAYYGLKFSNDINECFFYFLSIKLN